MEDKGIQKRIFGSRICRLAHRGRFSEGQSGGGKLRATPHRGQGLEAHQWCVSLLRQESALHFRVIVSTTQ